MTIYSRLISFFTLLLVVISCSAIDFSPADKLIKGPFSLSTKWQKVDFEKPLRSAPYAQFLQLLFCNNQMEFINLRPDEIRTNKNVGEFKRTSDNKAFDIEVIINRDNKEYKLSQTSSGSYYNGKAAGCLFIGFSLEGDGRELFIPEGVKFDSVKIRSSESVVADQLFWTAPHYDRYPDKKWKDLHPSTIINVQ